MGIATDIATVSTATPIYNGPRAAEATALTLVAVAQTESGFWGKVQDCSVCYHGSQWCDRGRSVTIYQLQGPVAWGNYTREQLCTNNRLATERAHAILYRFRTSASTVALFDAYMRGGQLRLLPSKGARQKDKALQYHLGKRGIRLSWRNGGMWAE